MDMLATLLAVGIDPKRAIIFHQDDVGSGLSCPSSGSFIHPFSCWRIRISVTPSWPGYSTVSHPLENYAG
jgi:hypothetical protein